MRPSKALFAIFALSLAEAPLIGIAQTQAFAVSLRVSLDAPGASTRKGSHPSGATSSTLPDESNGVAAWLTPIKASEINTHHVAAPAHSFVLTQKNKQFSPHLLVIPTGSNVDFPNLDPFFHNVFSLFNGRRFDLGLYEAGSRRSVLFDHDGVSYIFCNIHPEMGAVIISLSTPYFGVSDKSGLILMKNVPPGEYDLHLWSENAASSELAAAQQRVHISAQDLRLPPIVLKRTASPVQGHLNKFGEGYKVPEKSSY